MLLPFGGAGPLHAASLAEQLGISRLLCPRASGVLSALGLAAAAPRRDHARSVLLAGPELSAARLQEERRALLERARTALGEDPVRARVRHELRYRGQSFELGVDEELDGARPPMGPEQLREAFAAEHERRYGYSDPSGELELVTMRISVWGGAPRLEPATPTGAPPPRAETREIVFGGQSVRAPVFRGEPRPGTAIAGPALWALPEATLLVPPGWHGEVDRHGSALLERERPYGEGERP